MRPQGGGDHQDRHSTNNISGVGAFFDDAPSSWSSSSGPSEEDAEKKGGREDANNKAIIVHSVSPDYGVMHPATSSSSMAGGRGVDCVGDGGGDDDCDCNNSPPPRTYSSPFSSFSHPPPGMISPIKKQRTSVESDGRSGGGGGDDRLPLRRMRPLLPSPDSSSSSSPSSLGGRSHDGSSVDCEGRATTTTSIGGSPFTPRSRRMMMDLSIGPQTTIPEGWEKSSSYPPGGVGVGAVAMDASSSFGGRGAGRGHPTPRENAACSPLPAMISSSPLPSPSGGACGPLLPTPRGSPARGPGSRVATPIGRQRGSVFKMPPPRASAPVRSLASTPTSRREIDDRGDGCRSSRDDPPSPARRALCSSPSSLASSPSSTCASRTVPLTVLSRDGSPVLPRPSLPPAPAACAAGGAPASPLMRSLDRAFPKTPPTSPTMLPSVPRSDDGPGGGQTPNSRTAALLPKIKLAPRRGGRGPSLVPSPGDDGDYDDRPTFPSNFSDEPLPTTLSSSFEMGDEEVIMAEMDSLLDGFGHHSARFGGGPEEGSGPRMLGGGGGLERVESEEAEMVALLNRGPRRKPDPFCPPSLRRDRHHPSPRRPMPSITLNLETIGGGCQRVPSRSPSFLPRPVQFVRGGSRSLFDTTNDPIEGILLADAIAEAAKSNEPLTDDEGSEFGGDHSDFLLSMPSFENRREADPGRVTSSPVPSSKARQAETAARKRFPFRPRTTAAAGIHAPSLHSRPSLDNEPGDPWEAVGGSAPSSATAAHEGPDERAFSDAARRDRPSEPSRSEIPTSGPNCPRPSARDADVVAPTRADQPPSSAACRMLSMSSLCGLSIPHEIQPGGGAGSDYDFRRHASTTTPQLPPSESSEFAAAGIKPYLFRSEFSENSLGFSLDSNDGCVYQRDLFTPPVSMD